MAEKYKEANDVLDKKSMLGIPNDALKTPDKEIAQ